MKTIIRTEPNSGRTTRLTPERLELAFERVGIRRGAFALVTIENTFGLSRTGLGRLFGVSRQAIDAWIRDGVPGPRFADISRTLAVSQDLRKRFVPDRIASIVRSPIPALGNRTILATIEDEGVMPIVNLLDRLASFVPSL